MDDNQDNLLLDTPGCKRYCWYAKHDMKVQRIISQAKLSGIGFEPFWRFGVLLTRTHSQPMERENKNGNTKRQDDDTTAMSQFI